MGFAIALVLSAGTASDPVARAQGVPDSAALVPPARPAVVVPGEAVMAYGLASDSVVRARCEGAVVRRVDVHCLDIFDPVPAGRFSSIYRGANKLHVRTRSNTVRSLLLVTPRQLWTADRVTESERKLRDLEYIEPSAIRSRLVNDSVDVLVVTHDQWTTQPELNLERGGGRTFGSVGFTERNLLGLGLGVSVAYNDESTGRSRSGELAGRQLFGTQLDGQFKASKGPGGASGAVYLRDPYRSLDDPRSWAVSWWRTNAEQQLFNSGSLAARFPFRFEQAQVEYGFGKRFPDGLVRRFAVGFSLHDRNYGVTLPEPGVAVAFPGVEVVLMR